MVTRMVGACVCVRSTPRREDKDIPFRSTIAVKKQRVQKFVPDSVQEEALAGDRKRKLKLLEIGAMFNKHLTSFPSEVVQVVWEVSISASPPCQLIPVKPKAWIVKTFTMKKGQAYLAR